MEEVGDSTIVRRVVESDPTADVAASIFEFFDLAPDPPDRWYPVVGGAKDLLDVGTTVEWSWDAPWPSSRHSLFWMSPWPV